MYKALYRVWRPNTFDDVVGQDKIITTLKHQMVEDKLSHAYLFTGTRGTGKTSCAKILAKAVNCLEPDKGNPCGICALCQGIEHGSVLDVTEIDAASNNRVDDVRLLRDEIHYTPSKGKYRVYIIDEVHMLSISAFNALLKVMEEPPSYVIFILATTEIHKVPTTILSRCQRFDFRRIGLEDLSNRLLYISQQEKISLEKSGAEAIGILSDGGMRDAISLLDFCSVSGEPIDDTYVKKMCGLGDKSQVLQLLKAVVEKNLQGALEKLQQLHAEGAQAKMILEQLLFSMRNLLIVQTVEHPKGIVGCLEDELAFYESLRKKIKMSTLLSYLEVLSHGGEQLASSYFPNVDLELVVLKLIQHIQPERVVASKSIIPNPPPSKTSGKQAVQLEQSTEEGLPLFVDQESLPLEKFLDWPLVVQKLSQKNPAIHGAMKDSIGYIRGDTVLIDSENQILFKILRENENARDSLRECIKETVGKLYKLGPLKKEEKALKSSSKDTMVQDIIQNAKESQIEYIEK